MQCPEDMTQQEFAQNIRWKELAGIIRLWELENYTILIKKYASACHQLLENIVFHSVARWGVRSLRIHNSNNENDRGALEKKYALSSNDVNTYFEIEVCDCSGKKEGKDIAETFLAKLNQDDEEIFRKIRPINLFESSLSENDSMLTAWKTFYQNPENM